MEIAGRLTQGQAVRIESAQEAITAAWAVMDWSRAWLDPMREVGQRVGRSVAAGTPLWTALNQAAPAPVRFVPQTALAPGMAYEQFIAHSGTCPTREGLHDFFNGLSWIHYPATKRRLNQLQAGQIASDGIRPVRGPVRDALTVFDENAAFLCAPQSLWDALQAKQWPLLFGQLRPLWQHSQLLLFGHALLEKLHAPRKAITAHVIRVDLQQPSLADVDAWVAQALDAHMLAGKPFAHLPVLGVPGWWAANAAPAFYDDKAVFRPAR